MRLQSICLIMLATVLLGTASPVAADGGRVKLGGILIDEEGHPGVNQETYNLYEGFALSLEKFSLQGPGGFRYTADLENITLNNRNLRAGISKAGLFSLSLFNNQYRRIYDFDGGHFTRRNITGARAEVTPTRYLSLFGDFALINKHGTSQSIFRPIAAAAVSETDYSHTRFNVGGKITRPEGMLRIEYRRTDFTDDAATSGDRYANQFQATAFAPLPIWKRLTVSGGYIYREDVHDATEVFVKTNQGWAAAKIYFPGHITLDYRLLAARTEQSERLIEIDNYRNTVTLGYQIPRFLGVRVGYENRISDDLVDATETHGLLVSGWIRFTKNLMLRARLTHRDKNIDDGTLLVGEEEATRRQASLHYRLTEWGDIAVKYANRISHHEDLDVHADYNSFTTRLHVNRSEYGRLTVTYSYYHGIYENREQDQQALFSFVDHIVTGMVHPITVHNFDVAVGGTWYRSQRDKDVEKLGFTSEVTYAIGDGYSVQGRYAAYNFDDFTVTDRYYTGNIVQLFVIKDFTL